MKRSFCASGSGYVPSYSIGFCVAKTVKFGGSAWVSRSMRHQALLHGLQQRRLRLGGRAIDFVGQQERGEHRALDEA